MHTDFSGGSKVVWYSHPFKNFPQIVVHTVKGCSRVNKAEVYVFLEFYCFFYDPADVSNLISGSSAFSKSSLNIWKFIVHVLLKAGLENFEHYFASMWDNCYCAVVWTFVGIAFLWDWNEIWPFPVLWALQGFPYLLAYGRQHFHSIIFSNFKKFSWIPTLPLALFIVVFPKAHLISHFKMSGSRWMITPPWLTGLLVVMWDTQEAQEYWSQYPSPSPGYLPDPGIKLGPLHWRQILFLFFNWKITALQNFVVFCQTLT